MEIWYRRERYYKNHNADKQNQPSKTLSKNIQENEWHEHQSFVEVA